MIRQPLRLKPVGMLLVAPALLCLAGVNPAQAQIRRPAVKAFQAGQIILYVQPGTPAPDVRDIAAKVGAVSVEFLLLPDCYKLTLPAAKIDDQSTLDAVATLKPDARVRYVGPNILFQPYQTAIPRHIPNDPLYLSQVNGHTAEWDMENIRMPEVWGLGPGSVQSNVAVIDTGFNLKHEDVSGRFLSQSFNAADQTTDPTANGGVEDQHGVHVSGTIIANRDNAIGMAGMTWAQVTSCLAIKVVANATTTGVFDSGGIIRAFQYCATNKAMLNLVAVNCSFGAQGLDPADPNNPYYASFKACTDAGLLMSVSTGNSAADNSHDTPQGFQLRNSILVGATDRLHNRSSFSSIGHVTVMAPGGDQNRFQSIPEGTLSTSGTTGGAAAVSPTPNTSYDYFQGTSMAAPHVTGLIGMMMSYPGVTTDRVINVLTSTARKLADQSTVPDTNDGYGEIDAYAAITQVATSVAVVSPEGINPVTNTSTNANGSPPAPIETLRPTISFQVANIPFSSVYVAVQSTDGTSTPVVTAGQINPALLAGTDPVLSSVSTLPSTATSAQPGVYTFSFRYKVNPEPSTQQYTVQIAGASNGIKVTDNRVITVSPHPLSAGVSFVSFPIQEPATDSPTGKLRDIKELLANPGTLNSDVTLYRWVAAPVTTTGGATTVQGQYAVYSPTGSILPDYATLYPTGAVSQLTDGSVTDVRPLGVGYFIKLNAGTTVKSYGRSYSTQAVSLPLQDGWNMIGDPYTFPISFSTLTFRVGNGTTYNATDAANNGLILPFIYRLVGGAYQFDTLPGGILRAWEGNWIYVVPQNGALGSTSRLTALFSPTPAGTAQNTRSIGSRKNITRAVSGNAPTVRGAGSWSVQLVARTRNLSDAYNYVGMSSLATDGNDRTKAPKPPKFAPFVSLGIERANSPAGLYTQDLRSVGGTKQWNVVVSTDQANSDVQLTWPDVRNLPRTYRLTLTDSATGQSIDLRNQAVYQYNSGAQAETRRFTLEAKPSRSLGRAVLNNILINPLGTRGVGGSTGYELAYDVSQDVHVDVTLVAANGRSIGLIAPTRAVSSGSNKIVWTGRDIQGRALPAGTYILQFRAVTNDGAVTREVRALTLNGR